MTARLRWSVSRIDDVLDLAHFYGGTIRPFLTRMCDGKTVYELDVKPDDGRPRCKRCLAAEKRAGKDGGR